MKILFLAWQNPKSRDWFPVGRLTAKFDGYEDGYEFEYIKGAETAAKTSGFRPLTSFPDFQRTYRSKSLFPLFANRVMRHSRPDYQDYLEWLNLTPNEQDPLEILSRSGGQKVTDHLEVFPCPEPDKNGLYRMSFFLRGIRYRPPASKERVDKLEPLERLYLMRDLQNEYDKDALALRTKDDYFIGYCPRYLAPDIGKLLEQEPQHVEVLVEKLNPIPTPLQLRLLCSVTAPWPKDFYPFSSRDYQVIQSGKVGVPA